jgi:hypothetical protein
LPTKAEGSPKGVRKHVFSDARAGLTALSVYLGPFYVLTPKRRGVTLGRRRKLTSNDVAHALRMIESGEESVAGMARILKVGRNTLGRALKR